MQHMRAILLQRSLIAVARLSELMRRGTRQMFERRHMRGQKAFLGLGRLCRRERPAGVA